MAAQKVIIAAVHSQEGIFLTASNHSVQPMLLCIKQKFKSCFSFSTPAAHPSSPLPSRLFKASNSSPHIFCFLQLFLVVVFWVLFYGFILVRWIYLSIISYLVQLLVSILISISIVSIYNISRSVDSLVGQQSQRCQQQKSNRIRQFRSFTGRTRFHYLFNHWFYYLYQPQLKRKILAWQVDCFWRSSLRIFEEVGCSLVEQRHQDQTKVNFRFFFQGCAKRSPLFLGGEMHFPILQGQVYAADFLLKRFFVRQGGRKSRAQDANAENKQLNIIMFFKTHTDPFLV